jgi:hypothetical protein
MNFMPGGKSILVLPVGVDTDARSFLTFSMRSCSLFLRDDGSMFQRLSEDQAKESKVDIGVEKSSAPVWWQAKTIVKVANPAAQTKQLQVIV